MLIQGQLDNFFTDKIKATVANTRVKTYYILEQSKGTTL